MSLEKDQVNKGHKGPDNANAYFDDTELIASNRRAVVKTNTTDNLLSVLKKSATGQSFKKLEGGQLGVKMGVIAFLFPCSEALYHDKVGHLLSSPEPLAAESGISECSNPVLFQQAVHHRL